MWLAALVAAAALPFALGLDPYYTSLLTIAASYVLPVLGLAVLTGFAGQISLAQGMFFGIGAYCLALGTTRWHLSFALAVLVGIGLALVVGAALGTATLRIGGHYLAMVTLSIQLIFSLLLINWVSVTEGSDGVMGIPRPTFPGLSFNNSTRYLSLMLGAGVVFAACVWILGRSRLGRSMAAVRDDELAAGTAGVPTLWVKVAAFCVSAALAAIGGAFFAANLSYISPGSFDFSVSILFLAMALIGGSRSVVGSCVGAFLLVLLPEWLRFLGSIYYAIYGLALLAVIVYMPEGAAGAVASFWRQRRPRRIVQPDAFEELPTRAVTDQVLVELRGVRKAFGGVVAIDGVDMSIRAGEVHALIGPNGSGKTTLINMLSGVYRPSGGSICLNGHDLSRMPPHKIAALGVTRTFQLIRLFASLSVFDNVRLGAGVRWRAHWAETQRAWAALRLVGAERFASESASQLPQGHRKLVEIARALARQPAMIMLDEPAGGLNPAEKLQLVSVIRAIQRLGVTVLVVEHDMAFVRRVADRMTVLNYGRKIAEGKTSDVLSDPTVIDVYVGRDVEAAT